MFILFATFIGESTSDEPDEDRVQQLVRDARDGTHHAARRLYGIYVGRVFRAVRPLCGSEAEAEDVVQDTFIKAFGALHRYEPRSDTRFIAWLMTVALNVARKQARRRGRVELKPPEVMAAVCESGLSWEGGLDTAERQRIRSALLKALSTISERDRQIVMLRYGAELTAAEVGVLCTMSPENVRKICERQRQHLIGQLGGVGGEQEQIQAKEYQR